MSRGLRTTDELLQEVVRKLDQLIRITSLQGAADRSITESARMLKTAGLDNLTIAEILNTSPATVRTLTSNLRKKG
jgi:DNA-binding CsgD family transcriptional regulator